MRNVRQTVTTTAAVGCGLIGLLWLAASLRRDRHRKREIAHLTYLLRRQVRCSRRQYYCTGAACCSFFSLLGQRVLAWFGWSSLKSTSQCSRGTAKSKSCIAHCTGNGLHESISQANASWCSVNNRKKKQKCAGVMIGVSWRCSKVRGVIKTNKKTIGIK